MCFNALAFGSLTAVLFDGILLYKGCKWNSKWPSDYDDD